MLTNLLFTAKAEYRVYIDSKTRVEHTPGVELAQFHLSIREHRASFYTSFFPFSSLFL